MPTDKIADDDTSLPAVTVFEANNNHAVGSETFAPAVHAVVFTDAVGDNEFMVAAHADVVVAGVTFEAVIAGV